MKVRAIKQGSTAALGAGCGDVFGPRTGEGLVVQAGGSGRGHKPKPRRKPGAAGRRPSRRSRAPTAGADAIRAPTISSKSSPPEVWVPGRGGNARPFF